MTSESTWETTPTRKKLFLYLEQAEWAIFQADMLGIEIDQRSLDAVTRTRQCLFGAIDVKALDKSISDSYAKEAHDSYIGAYSKNGVWIDECAITMLCWHALIDVLWIIDDGRDLSLKEVFRFYLDPIEGSKYLCTVRDKSPLAVWLIENGDEECEPVEINDEAIGTV